MNLVRAEEAIQQVRQIPGQDDHEILTKLDEAEAWAREVLGANFNEEWTDATLPLDVRSAIMARLSGLYDADKDMLALADRLIDRWRDRTLA